MESSGAIKIVHNTLTRDVATLAQRAIEDRKCAAYTFIECLRWESSCERSLKETFEQNFKINSPRIFVSIPQIRIAVKPIISMYYAHIYYISMSKIHSVKILRFSVTSAVVQNSFRPIRVCYVSIKVTRFNNLALFNTCKTILPINNILYTWNKE